EAVAHFFTGLADRDGARNVGSAVLILRAGIDQQQVAARNAPVGLAGNAVMHDGTVRPGTGDRGKRNILERAGVAAKRLQRLDGSASGSLTSAVRSRWSRVLLESLRWSMNTVGRPSFGTSA